MRCWNGIWLPSADRHMPALMGTALKPIYQLPKLEAALAHVKAFRVAVDVGAHVGLWSMHLARRFERVEAFEPVSLHRGCFLRNLDGCKNVRLHCSALGSGTKRVRMVGRNRQNTGETFVALAEETGDENADLRRLDDMVTGPVDFLKIDCEGYEAFVIQGGMETITRDRPVIVVEQHDPHLARYGLPPKFARNWLICLGYREVAMMGDDHIMVPM